MSGGYRILSLIEMCSDGHSEGRTDKGLGEATQKASGWLVSNPGRWFIVGEIVRDRATGNSVTVGLKVRTMTSAGFEVECVNNKVYARHAHESGVPLSDFVTRKKPVGKGDMQNLPTLASDPFGWTVAELSDACVTAYEWLSGGRRLEAA